MGEHGRMTGTGSGDTGRRADDPRGTDAEERGRARGRRPCIATGETGPPPGRAGARLERPPGDRYGRAATAGPASAVGDPMLVPPTTGVQPRFALAVLHGELAVVGVAAAWALAAGVLDVSWGLLIVAALGGWVIGSAVALGAWRGEDHHADTRLQAIAAGNGVVAWLLGTFGAYVVALWLLPASELSLEERMANVPFSDALVTQFSLVDIASIALLAAIAWRSAR